MRAEYNFTHRMPITRNRQFEVFINRKSVTFRVHYHAGFLRGWQVLGRATLELKPLLKSCEALAVAEVRRWLIASTVQGGLLRRSRRWGARWGARGSWSRTAAGTRPLGARSRCARACAPP